MKELIKIRDISLKYDISARALKYYEDMGLINSTRGDDYAYRMYDEAAVKRLEQILILRKLNISIKDIQRIFNTSGSEVVLEVLGKKVDSIDEEVSLLHELKGIVLDFIRQIKESDFGKDSDVKQLYDKSREIEVRISNIDTGGNPANVNRLIEITERLDKKIPDIMIVRIPKFRALISGYYTFADKELWNLMGWESKHKYCYSKDITFNCSHFLTRGTEHNNGKFSFICAVKDDVTETDTTPYKIMEFVGGLYAMAVSIDNDHESGGKVENKIFKWMETTNFEYDGSRDVMGHMAYNGEDIKKGLGYEQLQRYVPIKLKEDI